MTDYIKARFYAYRYSRNLIVTLVSMAIWIVGNIINVYVLNGQGDKFSLYYGVWAFTEFYLCFIPVVASTWYFNTSINGFDGNVPFQSKNRCFNLSAVLFTYMMNTLMIIATLVLGLVIYSIPNGMVVYINDPVTMAKGMSILLLTSYCRCSFVMFVTELTESRIWGTVLGMLVSCGMFGDFVCAFEVTLYAAIGVKETTMPLTSFTSYYMINNIIPHIADEEGFIVRTIPGNVFSMLMQMIVYIALFTWLTTMINKRKDVLR